LFPEDYDKHNATKKLIQKMRSIEARIDVARKKDVRRELQVALV
jgi:cell fate (sporulation/competence/biofilm development) regulator YmcA (YheA/YmcA/DUF963 family)